MWNFRFLLQNLSYSQRAPQTVPNERLCFRRGIKIKPNLSFKRGGMVLQGNVILGLDPRIHKETSKVPVGRWIAGSKPGNDKKKKNPRVTIKIKRSGNDNKERARGWQKEKKRG